MSSIEIDEKLARVMICLTSTAEDPELFLDRRRSGIQDLDFGQAALAKLKRAGIVETKKLGERSQGWRLTQAGQERLDDAHAVIAQITQQRREAWLRENCVHGANWLQDDTELSTRQQRAWLRGHFEALLANMEQAPDDAPQAVRENWPNLQAWMGRSLQPHRPDWIEPEELLVKARKPR